MLLVDKSFLNDLLKRFDPPWSTDLFVGESRNGPVPEFWNVRLERIGDECHCSLRHDVDTSEIVAADIFQGQECSRPPLLPIYAATSSDLFDSIPRLFDTELTKYWR